MNIAIALFLFNRPDHTKNILKSLSACEDLTSVDVHVFIDGPRSEGERDKVSAVSAIVDNVTEMSFKSISRREKNSGLAPSIISGVSNLFKIYDAVIVLEDDLILSRYYIRYMKESLYKYQDNKLVFSISGFNYPREKMPIDKSYPYDVYFSYRPHSWGWATWRDKWAKGIWEINPDLDVFINSQASERFNRGGSDLTQMLKLQHLGKISSWAIRWAYTHYKLNVYSLYPVHSLVENNGFDGSGTHCKGKKFEVNLNKSVAHYRYPNDVILDPKITQAFYNVFKAPKKSKIRVIAGKLKGFLKSFFK